MGCGARSSSSKARACCSGLRPGDPPPELGAALGGVDDPEPLGPGVRDRGDGEARRQGDEAAGEKTRVHGQPTLESGTDFDDAWSGQMYCAGLPGWATLYLRKRSQSGRSRAMTTAAAR